MNVVDKALETQLNNIQTRTGKTLAALYSLLKKSGLTKHGEMRDMLKKELGMGHGDANTLVTVYLRSLAGPAAPAAAGASSGDLLDEIYAGPKAGLRPVHEKLLKAIDAFGVFEIAPKKGYVSLRRKKQFAMVGPGTKGRLEIGLNLKDVPPTERLVAQPAGGMCQYKVWVTEAKEIDKELVSWVRQAYDSAG